MPKDKDEIPEGEDYKIRPMNEEEKERNNTDEDIPEYRINIKLNDEQKDRLTAQAFLEFEALENERKELKLEDKWRERDSQYDGTLRENKRLIFNLHSHQTKIKEDAIVRAISEAFLDSDPIVDIAPRPEMADRNGFDIADKQTKFIDFAMDEEIKPEQALIKIARSAVRKFVGIGKLEWAYRREKRKREETYEGKNEIVGVQNGQPVLENEGLKNFLNTYPDAMEKQKSYVKRLLEEKKIEIVVEYKDTINNNPKLKYVKIEDFYVRNGCDYWEGLRTEHCIVERENYTYWDLVKKQKDGEFENIEVTYANDNTDNPEVGAKDYTTEDYDVLKFTIGFKLNEGDEEEVKLQAWFGEDKKNFLGAILFPYYAFDTEYIPFYVKLNDYGFYGNAMSVVYDLRDSNIAQDALLNLALHGTYIRNTLTPIVKEGSEIEQLFLENTWQEGRPLPVDEMVDDVSKAIGFVQWPSMDLNGVLGLKASMQKIDSDVTGVTDLMTGRESPTDPTAPASKTIALLNQSGLNIKDYIRNFIPSFNILVEMILLLYYQMSQEGRKFKVKRKSGEVVGENPFASITRDEMVAKTTIQARASSFAFDKTNEKQEGLAAYQVVTANPYAMQQPIVMYKALLTLMNTFGPRWKNIADNDLLSPEDFKAQQQQVAMEAVKAYLQQAQQEAQVTGVDPNVQPEQLTNAVTQGQAVAYNPMMAQQGEPMQGSPMQGGQ